jgi:hypothetical protein
VNDGRSAIYLWSHADAPAVCAVSRHGRLGWALQDAEGPENADLPPARLEEICYAFAAAGIPGEAAIEALEHVASAQSLRRHGIRHRRLHRRDEDAEIAEVYEELEALQAT